MTLVAEAMTALVNKTEELLDAVRDAPDQTSGDRFQTNLDRIQTGQDRIDVLAVVGPVQANAQTAITQAGIATAAKVAAELSASQAAAATRGRPSTTAALADATIAVGTSFTAPLADGSLQAYMKDSGSVATAFGLPFPTAATVALIADAERARVDQPNVFTKEQLAFTVLPATVGGTIAGVTTNGLKAGKLSTDPATGAGRCRWILPASAFPSGKLSAQIVVDSIGAGTSGTISVVERNSGGTSIATTVIATGFSAASTTPTPYRISGIVLNPLTATVDLDVIIGNTVGDKLRDVVLRSMLMCDGVYAGFRQPPMFVPEVPVFNRFINPQLTSVGSNAFYQATKVVEIGEDVLLMTGGAGVTSQAYYDEPALGILAPGSTLTLTAEAMSDVSGTATSADFAIIFLDAAGATIGGVINSPYTTPNVWQSQTLSSVVPAGAVTVRCHFVKRTQAVYGKFRRVVLTSNNTLAKTLHIPRVPLPAGAVRVTVVAGGTYPTIQAGVDAAKPFGLVIVREGDYAPFNVSGFYGRVMAYRNERVRVVSGILLTGITKTAGATSVYQAALVTKPNHYIWEHDAPDVSTLISISERHPAQRGETYRLPSTRYFEAASIAAVDAAATPAWFHSTGVIYFKTRDGSAPGARQLYVPGVAAAVTGGTGDESVDISGIAGLYGINGFRLSSCARVVLNRCSAMFSSSDGFSLDDNIMVQNNHPRAGGNGNDGTNGHNYATNPNNVQSSVVMVEPWCHDNWDDCDSLHERFVGGYTGGLYEYSGSGIATAYGAHVTLHGGIVRKNGVSSGNGNPSPKNLGVSSIGDATDGGYGTQVICYNTISTDNGNNFSASATGNTILCVNTKSFLGAVAGYSASAGGSIELMDCTDSGSLVAKTGAVTVKNTTLVV